MHFTLFQVLAGITRLPHCCVTLARPLCLPIMSYYKLQRPEFNKDNLTPTYNTILNTDGTVRSPKGKGMRAAADSDVIQRHIVLGAEFLQLKKGQIHRKLHNYYNKNRKRFRCFHIRADVRWAHLHHSPVMSSIRLAFKSSTFSVNDFFFFYNSFTKFKDPFFHFYFAFLSLCLKTNTRTGNLYQTMCSPPQRKSLPLLLAHCFTHPCSFISYRSIQNTFSLLTDEALPDNRLGTKTISAHADSNCSTFQYIQRSSGFAFSKAPNRY